MNLNQETQATNKFRIPESSYGVRCIDAEFKILGKNMTPCIQLTWEICDPEEIKTPSGAVKIAGIKATGNFWLTQKAGPRLTEFHKIMGLPLSEFDETDAEFMKEFVRQYRGLGAKAMCKAKEIRLKKEVIDEEDGSVVKEDMLDDEGKPIVSYSVEVGMFLKKDDRFKVEMV